MNESTDVRLARLETKFDALISDIAEIKKEIKGNGKPGLVERITEVEKKIAENSGGRKMLTGILGSSTITGIIVYAVQKIFN